MENKLHNNIDVHRYILRRGVEAHDDGAFVAIDIVISMGKHGEMLSSPVYDQNEKPAVSTSRVSLVDITEHNIAETRRAIEEGKKWEMRMKDSPLGKTQQDFVAYYSEVISLFKEWHITHGISLLD